MNSFARKAPVWVVVVREKSGYVARLGGFLRGVKYSLIDTGIAAEHLVLQAEEEGLGTCWLGWFNERVIKRGLGIPRDKSVDIIISMGYPAEDTASPAARPRRSPEEVLRFNNG
jgi:nitroreductase